MLLVELRHSSVDEVFLGRCPVYENEQIHIHSNDILEISQSNLSKYWHEEPKEGSQFL